MEDQVRRAHGRHRHQRAAIAHQQVDDTGGRQGQHAGAKDEGVPGIDERSHQRKRYRPRGGVRVEHLSAHEIFAGLATERGEIRTQSAADHQQWNTPCQPAGHEHDAATDQRARHAAADAIQ